MGKLLRILVIIIMIVGIGAVVLAWLNFSKRELLIGRTQKLEQTLTRLAATIEAVDPALDVQPHYPSRDISPVTSRIVENPELDPFWDDYEAKFERVGQPTLNFATEDQQLQLREYYQRDAMGNRVPDPRYGGYLASGPNTMQELLDQVLERATRQYANLNSTRAQLQSVREELVRTIEELNREKRTRRQNLQRIEELEATVQRLEREKRELEQRIQRLEAEKRELQAEIAEQREEIAVKNEIIENQQSEIARIQKLYDDLIQRDQPIIDPRGREMQELIGVLTPGDHGRVLSADEAWGFVIIELDQKFMVELIGPELDKPMPQAEMMIRRPGFQGPAEEFVTKIRLRHVVRDHRVVIADILLNWQQVPIRPGDVVFF